jgi:hypothetical protein
LLTVDVPPRDRDDVVDLEAFARAAHLAVGADERALAAVALPDLAADGSGDVAGVGGGAFRRGLPRAPGRRAAALAQVRELQRDRALDHFREVARGHRVAEQFARGDQLVVRLLAEDRDQLEPLRPDRSQPRAASVENRRRSLCRFGGPSVRRIAGHCEGRNYPFRNG